MKRFALIILFIAFTVASVVAGELYIDAFFTDNIMLHRDVTAVVVKGKELKPYKLTSFRSITVTGNAKLAKMALKWITKDAKMASHKEEGIKNGCLQYGFYVFDSGGNKNRFIFFRVNKSESDVVADITVVDMTGKATFGELKQMFK